MNYFAKTILTTFFLLYLTLLCSCVSPVYTDYDHEAVSKFAQYNCFEIVSSENYENDEDVVLGPILNRRIERELKSILQTLGFTDQCSLPDFRVRYHTTKKTIRRLNSFGVGTFRERCYGYPGFVSYQNFYIDQYEEGTFLVDIIDPQLDEVVWRGAYVKRLGMQALSDKEIRAMLAKILDRFPPEIRPNTD